MFLRTTELNLQSAKLRRSQKVTIYLETVPGFYAKRILKSEIGLKVEYDWKQVVILDKRDDELAKKYISDYISKEIAKRQAEIDEFQKQLAIINEWNKDNE